MPTSLPTRHDARSQDETAGRLAVFFVIVSVIGFVGWCVADHVAQHVAPMVTYASTAPKGLAATR
jgi:hypothetical protein